MALNHRGRRDGGGAAGSQGNRHCGRVFGMVSRTPSAPVERLGRAFHPALAATLLPAAGTCWPWISKGVELRMPCQSKSGMQLQAQTHALRQ
jgi:hypothetical protein